ncbi:uncharacterized protein LOC116159922 [Photinus pyralis]|uniref:uncharacterized protein LOC116159922 n=1 Tax=Photinus pyralis TaxID=7054 RepID=UPI001266FE84|nr:uncharacterized protein LOC116159922 [Photinus pyralis]
MVEEDFNSSLPNGVFRDWECLKRFYENQRKEVRKIKSNERQELLRTGGGQVPPTKDDPADMLLLSIMNEKTVSGLKNKFDSDCDVTPVAIEVGDTLIFDMDTNDPECDVPSPASSATQKRKHDEDEIVEQENPPVAVESWKHYKPSNLQNPINPVLNEQSTSRTPLRSNRRRPVQQIKALSSSAVAEKYEQLLNKRLILVEKQILQLEEDKIMKKEKQRLELQLLELEIEIKKKTLN